MQPNTYVLKNKIVSNSYFSYISFNLLVIPLSFTLITTLEVFYNMDLLYYLCISKSTRQESKWDG